MSVLNFTAKTWAAAEKVTAALLNAQLRDPLTNLQSAWTSYTPALTASTTNPTLGTGSSASGSYHRWGKTVVGNAYITFGTSGVAAGSGTYRVSFPVTPKAGLDRIVGAGLVYDSSVAAMYPVVARAFSGFITLYIQGTGSAAYAVGGANPFAWAASDQIICNFTYEAA